LLKPAGPYGGILNGLAPREAIVVALSGGGDSTALLLMAKDALLGSATRLVAVTVDHGLRPESAAEAAEVARFCGAEGIEHRIAVWQGEKPRSGVAAAARLARHGLLAEAARTARTDIVLIGHTLDDQAETVAMRRARGEGAGLAGIAPATLFRGRTWFVRPLLGLRREALREELRRRDVGWIDDPSNLDRRNERARVRADMTGSEGLLAEGRAAGMQRIAAMQAAGALIRKHAAMPSPGLVSVADVLLDDRKGHLALRLLLAGVGGSQHLPTFPQMDKLVHVLAQPGAKTGLSRALVEQRGDRLYLWRENRGLPRLAPVADMLWDRRWHIASGMATDLEIAPLGQAARSLMAEDAAPRGSVFGALAAEPGLWRAGRLLGPLQEKAADFGVSAGRVVAPYADFLPSFDLAAAAALARLLGAAPLPASPFVGHIDAEA
jgi:tRNA(Ile)-lysidine synthase